MKSDPWSVTKEEMDEEDERTPISLRVPCTLASHDEMRNDVAKFKAGIRAPQVWGNLFVGHCRNCDSTLALYLCFLCGDVCPNTDALPTKDGAEDVVAHAGCMINKAVREGAATFKERS